MPAAVRPTFFRYALSGGVLRRDGPGLTQSTGRGDPVGKRAARGSFAIMPRPPRASGKAPRARDAMRTSLGVWRQTSRSRGQGCRIDLLGCGWRECDGRFDTGKGRGSQTASSRRPWRMVDLATRPVQAGRPQTLVEAAQNFVERPILLGTRFEIPGTGEGLKVVKSARLPV